MTSHEIYPGTPLVSVTFELRHPESEAIHGARRSALHRALETDYPLMRSQQSFTQTFDLGPGGSVSQPVREEFPRFLNRNLNTSVSFTKTSTIIETSAYPGWATFRAEIETICEARNSVEPILGIERLGLRYIDEVRVNMAQTPGWEPWIHESLLAGRMESSAGLPLRLWQGTLVYGSEPGQGLVLRYGPAEGYAVDPGSDLRRPEPVEPGPFFLLDIDSFWVPIDGVPVYDAGELIVEIDKLHKPVRQLFESSITDKYRDEVLRK